MAVQKLHRVDKSRKDQGKCGRCGDPLPAGTGYQYWVPGFRARYKNVRCLKPECTPTPAERETSKAATILFAQEGFNRDIGALDSPEDIEAAVAEVADAVTEVRDEYQEALDSWENGNEQLQEKVEHYEEQLQEIEYWSWDGPTDYDLCEEHDGREDNVPEEEIQDCGGCQQNRDAWLDDCRTAAEEVVNSVETA